MRRDDLGLYGQERKAHKVDALAVRGEERRGSLRKAPGSWQQALIRGYLNGETQQERSCYPSLNT